MELNQFMELGMTRILSTAAAFYVSNRKGMRFLTEFVPSCKEASGKRAKSEQEGVHIPPFLIASIASSCNLHCKGCYARAEGMCGNEASAGEMGTEDWENIFTEAEELGISFILLAGGEPLLKREIIETAAKHKKTAFPVFTNGLLLKDDYIELFDQNRNLIPVISIEGSNEQTDARRGEGTAERIHNLMQELKKRKIMFAVSITVTTENMEASVENSFLEELRKKGCGVVFYVEYVPIQKDTEYLALSEAQNKWLNETVSELKQKRKDMILLSFPGDEEKMGGCLAAGRGFFHINPNGSAEPCPFSPYSKDNLKNVSLKEVLQSHFFKKVREITAEEGEHMGGCTLFLQEKKVKSL